MKILITGQAKSGTTALYFSLKHALASDYICLFEPKEFTGTQPKVLAKVLINPSTRLEDFAAFDKKILLVRDPRDNLVSRLLYAVYDGGFAGDDIKVSHWLNCLRKKSEQPGRLSVLDLLRELSELAGEDMLERFLLRHRLGFEFGAACRGFHIFRYEDFVAGRWADLEDYLGFLPAADVQLDNAVAHTARTCGSGDWRNWFTSEDSAYFADIFRDYLLAYDYGADWVSAPFPSIRPEHSTQYVEALVRKRRLGIG